VAFALRNHETIVPRIRKRFKLRAAAFSGGLKECGWSFIEPKGSCFIWAKPPVKISSIDAVCLMLERAALLAAPGSGFGKYGEGYIRFSLTEPEQVLAQAIKRIKSIDWRGRSGLTV